MDKLDERLMHCFSSVFPEMNDEGIRSADVVHLADVDSLAAVTLVALIDEEFGVDMDLEGLLSLGNFEAVRQALLEYGTPSVLAGDQRVQ
jgi:acyl carrier protein